jgi:hypothetical protein
MHMPQNIRARNIIEHYLDSLNRPNKIELLTFIKIEDADVDNSDIFKKIESDSVKRDSEKLIYKNLLDSANNESKPNSFFCVYRIKGIKQAFLIRLNNTLSKVDRFTKLNQ